MPRKVCTTAERTDRVLPLLIQLLGRPPPVGEGDDSRRRVTEVRAGPGDASVTLSTAGAYRLSRRPCSPGRGWPCRGRRVGAGAGAVLLAPADAVGDAERDGVLVDGFPGTVMIDGPAVSNMIRMSPDEACLRSAAMISFRIDASAWVTGSTPTKPIKRSGWRSTIARTSSCVRPIPSPCVGPIRHARSMPPRFMRVRSRSIASSGARQSAARSMNARCRGSRTMSRDTGWTWMSMITT